MVLVSPRHDSLIEVWLFSFLGPELNCAQMRHEDLNWKAFLLT